jgi:1-acyl-sn-glycerol-3-phosphate acyltransferase
MFDDAAWARFSFAPIREAEALGAVCTCEGFQSLLSGGPFVYAANHMSLLETIVLPAALLAFSPLAVVVKRSLLSYPVFGGPLRAVRPIAVSRRDARRDLLTVLEEGSARLASGQSVLLFPQATRTAVFDPQRFNSLGAKLARRAGRPLVPVALRTDFAAAGRFLRDIGPIDPGRPIRFAAGAPLPPTGHGRSLHAACLAFLHQRLRSWGLPVAPLPAAETPGEGS